MKEWVPILSRSVRKGGWHRPQTLRFIGPRFPPLRQAQGRLLQRTQGWGTLWRDGFGTQRIGRSPFVCVPAPVREVPRLLASTRPRETFRTLIFFAYLLETISSICTCGTLLPETDTMRLPARRRRLVHRSRLAYRRENYFRSRGRCSLRILQRNAPTLPAREAAFRPCRQSSRTVNFRPMALRLASPRRRRRRERPPRPFLRAVCASTFSELHPTETFDCAPCQMPHRWQHSGWRLRLCLLPDLERTRLPYITMHPR